MTPTFEDKHTYDAGYGYNCTNEEPLVIRDLLRGHRVRRAAVIASGGEVTFFAILPRTTHEVVAIDHSYRSLAIFALKAHFLETRGAKATRALFVDTPHAALKEAVDAGIQTLPEPLQSSLKVSPIYDAAEIRREWFYMPDDTTARAAKKINRLSLIHGDLTDLKEKGPFDLLYLSNALEHSGRDRLHPNPAILSSLVKVGGLVVVVVAKGSSPGNKGVPPYWKLLKSMHGVRTTWDYRLYLREAEKKEEVADVPAIPGSPATVTASTGHS